MRGPVLETFYARLHRCGDLTCTGRPFTEHSGFPVLVIRPGDPRPAWQQGARPTRIGEAIRSGRLVPGETLPVSAREFAARHGLPAAGNSGRASDAGGRRRHHGPQGRRSAVRRGEPATARSRNARPGDREHDCARSGCRQHQCRPMSGPTIRQITPSCPELSARGPVGVESSQPGGLREAAQASSFPLRLRVRPPWPRSSPPRVRIRGIACPVPVAGGRAQSWRAPRRAVRTAVGGHRPGRWRGACRVQLRRPRRLQDAQGHQDPSGPPPGDRPGYRGRARRAVRILAARRDAGRGAYVFSSDPLGAAPSIRTG